MKHILIPWSGGLDSSYLIFKALSEGHLVTTCSFALTYNNGQSKLEEKAREKLKDMIREEFPNASINYHDTINITVKETSGNIILPQALIWILTLMLDIREECDEIWLGYVLRDDAVSFTKEITQIYNSIKPLSHLTKFPKLKFPIIKKLKAYLIEEFPSLKWCVSFCENPDLITYNDTQLFVPCGQCDSCLRHKRDTFADIQYLRERMIIDHCNQKHSQPTDSLNLKESDSFIKEK